MESKRKLPLAFWIFVGLLVGIAAGMALMNISVGGIEGKDFAKAYIKPWGDIFLNLLKFVVVPIVLFSIAAGVISMKDISKVGSIGLKTIVYYMCTTAFAVILALILASVAKGMHWFPLLETSGLSYEAPAGQSFMDTIVSIFPSNAVQPLASATMLQVIVISLFLGFGVLLAGEKGLATAQIVDSLNEVFINTSTESSGTDSARETNGCRRDLPRRRSSTASMRCSSRSWTSSSACLPSAWPA